MSRLGAVVGATAIIALVAGCHWRGGWSPEAPFAPSLRPAFGARVADGQLRIWSGSRCDDVTRLAGIFEPDRAQLVLTARPDRPATVEYLALGGPYPGLAVSEPLADGFDWRSAESVRISVYGGGDSWGSYANIADIVDGSDQHPSDNYLFEGVGWLNAADVAAQDGKTFLATCTPDPSKE